MKRARGLGAMFDTPRARVVVGLYAAMIVAADFVFALGRAPSFLPRIGLAMFPALVAAILGSRDPRGAASLGLAPLDADDRRWWTRVLLVAGGVCAAGLAAIAILSVARGAPLYKPPMWGTPTEMFVWGGLLWPVYEETIYRLTLLPACVALVGHRAAFAIGAGVFALLHLAYGNLDPSNIFGSIVLTWAFLRSGSLLLTTGLHIGGNAVLITAHVTMHALR